MAVERFTDQQTFAFNNLKNSRVIIANPASGGSVTVEVYDGQDWIQTDQFTSPNAYEIYTGGIQVRITPDGSGTAYALDMSEGNL